MRLFALLLAVVLLIASHASAQTKQVIKGISDNALTESLVVPTGKTLTINSGGTIINNGTATGFTTGLAIGTSAITGGTSGHVLYNNAGTLGGLATTIGGNGESDANKIPLLNASGGLILGKADLVTDAVTTLRVAYGNGMNSVQNGLGYAFYGELNASDAEAFHGHVTDLSSGGHYVFNADTTGGTGRNHGFTATVRSGGVGFLLQDKSGSVNPRFGMQYGGVMTWFANGTNYDTGTNKTTLAVETPSGTGSYTLKAGRTGDLISTGDTGTVTSTMLAGSIALSKLATTGTANSSTFLRGDGAWSSIDLSSYLPLTGGTLTGPLTITAGTATTSANPLSITQTWNGAGVTFQGPRITITDTNSAISEQYFGLYAGASGTTKLLSVEKISNSNVVEMPALRSTSNLWSLDFSEVGLAFGSARRLSWSSTVNYYDTKDLILSRDGAAKLKLGLDSSTPVSQQILTAHASGTNIAASTLTLGGSLSTGTGAGGDVRMVTSMSGSSGSTANTTQERFNAIGRYKDLTESTATNIASIALASGKMVGGTASITVWASDGTDYQAITSQVRFSAINKAGTITTTCNQTDGTTAASAGTLIVTYDTTQSGSAILLRASATSSLTQTTLRCRAVITALNGDDVQTVTPQ